MPLIWDIRRTHGDAKLAGLCGGVAAKWGIDPLLVRVAAVVLALSGGLGAVVYGAGWLLLPKEGESTAVLSRRFPATDQIPRNAWLVITGVVALFVMVTLGSAIPIGTGPVIAIAAVWYFFFHRPRQKAKLKEDRPGGSLSTGSGATRTFEDAAAAWQQRISQHMTSPRSRANRTDSAGAADAPPTGPPVAPTGPQVWAQGRDRFAEPAGWSRQLPPTVPAAVRMEHTATASFFAHPDPAGLYPATSGRRSGTAVATPTSTKRLTKLAVAAAVVILGGLGVLDAVGALNIGLATYASAALLVAAVTLVASAWMGRPKGLVAITAVLAVLSVGTQAPAPSDSQAPSHIQLSGPVSEMPMSHDAGTGESVFDLEGAEVDQDTRIDIDGELGTVRVMLPDEGNVRVVATNELGEISLPNGTISGADQTLTYERIEEPGEPVLELHVTMELGSAEVMES